MSTFWVLRHYLKCFDIKESVVNPLGVLRNLSHLKGSDF